MNERDGADALFVKALATMPGGFAMSVVIYARFGVVWPFYLYVGWFFAVVFLMVLYYPGRS